MLSQGQLSSSAGSIYTVPALTGVAIVVSPPATASSTGTPGQIAYDASYIYICTATDTWLRASIATW